MKDTTAVILLWTVAVIGFVVDLVRGILLVARGARVEGDVLIVPYFHGWRIYIHHIPHGNYETERMLLPLTYEYHREMNSTAPIAAIKRAKLDELITESVNDFID